MEVCSSVVKCLIFITFFLHLTSAVTHTLQYIYTGVTPGINFPEFTLVGQVDGEQFSYYDSNIRKMIPKTEWIQKVTSEDPDYWNSETQISQGTQETFKVNIDTAMRRFNQNTGVHTVQEMYGCELDDDGTIRGYRQFGYDGEDFLSFDVKTLTWIAPIPQAVITKHKWDNDYSTNRKNKNYLENICIEWLQKYVSYGRETLERKVRPKGTVFQRQSPSSEVVCHATGFFPKSVMINWQKDGKDVYDDVDLFETLPNHDGSFQKRSVLKVSAEELQKHKYTCVIQHSSLEEDLVLELSVTHSMQYFYTAVTPGINVPEFTTVGQVDGEQIVYYDSNIRKMIPKTEWIQKNVGEAFWNGETTKAQGQQETFKGNVDTLMKRFSQTTGIHTFQLMCGCEREHDGTTSGYTRYGYDGEDFLILDLKTKTWIAPIPQAVITKYKWDSTGDPATQWMNFLENNCIEQLQMFVKYGRETLERKVKPEASLFQKESSPEVVCHATGFFPKSVMITWQKDGEAVYEDVDLSETLPNQDGSFQKRSILKVSAEELQKHNYTCVIQHSSLRTDLVLPVRDFKPVQPNLPVKEILPPAAFYI